MKLDRNPRIRGSLLYSFPWRSAQIFRSPHHEAIWGEQELTVNLFLTSPDGVSGHPHAPATLIPRKEPAVPFE